MTLSHTDVTNIPKSSIKDNETSTLTQRNISSKNSTPTTIPTTPSTTPVNDVAIEDDTGLTAPINKPLRPKRGINTIFQEYEWDKDFPPTLAQFIDQHPDDNTRLKLVHQYKTMISLDQAWKLEGGRQRVLQVFPRAFDHDLTDEERNYVRLLMDIEIGAGDSFCNPATWFIAISFIFAFFVLIIAWWTSYGINLLWYAHISLQLSLSPTPLTQIGGVNVTNHPKFLDVVLNPWKYSSISQNNNDIQYDNNDNINDENKNIPKTIMIDNNEAKQKKSTFITHDNEVIP